MRPGEKRANAKPVKGSRYSKDRKLSDEKVRVVTKVIVKEAEPKAEDNIIFGRNSVMELLKSEKNIEALYTTDNAKEGSINKILAMAREKKIIVKYVDRKKLEQMTGNGSHQGIAARITDFEYCDTEDMLKLAKMRGEDPFILLLDEIEDPHNLGSLIRTAELTGVHGIVIPKRRSVGVTATVYKTSAGAVQNMLVARVTNLAAETEQLKERGIFVYGADMEGDETSDKADMKGPCALVIGNEGKGISRVMREKCDKIVSIPMVGKLNSLNASVAGGILMYEVMKGRLSEKEK